MRFLLIFFLFTFMLSTTGCGVKPAKLSAPKNSDITAYPRSYPAPHNVSDRE